MIKLSLLCAPIGKKHPWVDYTREFLDERDARDFCQAVMGREIGQSERKVSGTIFRTNPFIQIDASGTPLTCFFVATRSEGTLDTPTRAAKAIDCSAIWYSRDILKASA